MKKSFFWVVMMIGFITMSMTSCIERDHDEDNKTYNTRSELIGIGWFFLKRSEDFFLRTQFHARNEHFQGFHPAVTEMLQRSAISCTGMSRTSRRPFRRSPICLIASSMMVWYVLNEGCAGENRVHRLTEMVSTSFRIRVSKPGFQTTDDCAGEASMLHFVQSSDGQTQSQGFP